MYRALIDLLRRHSWRVGFTLLPLLLLLMHSIGFWFMPVIQRLDDILYDERLRFVMPKTLDERIVIVDIDEKSLSQLGQWPWGRDKMAQLMNVLLLEQQVDIVAFDVLFPQSDNSSGLNALKDLAKGSLKHLNLAAELKNLEYPLNFDERFAETLVGHNAILGYYFSSDRKGFKQGELPKPIWVDSQWQLTQKITTSVAQTNTNRSNQPIDHSPNPNEQKSQKDQKNQNQNQQINEGSTSNSLLNSASAQHIENKDVQNPNNEKELHLAENDIKKDSAKPNTDKDFKANKPQMSSLEKIEAFDALTRTHSLNNETEAQTAASQASKETPTQAPLIEASTNLKKPLTPEEISALLAVPHVEVFDWDGYGANMPLFNQSAKTAGFINSITDHDGVVRSLPLLAHHDYFYYESLALAVFRVAKKLPFIYPVFSTHQNDTLEGLLLSSKDEQTRLLIPVNQHGSMLVSYRGAGGAEGGSFRYVSAVDLIEKKIPKLELKNRIVLIGATAPGLLDLRTTPAGQIYPGVEVHANAISSLLDGRIAVRPDYAIGFEVFSLVITGIGLALALPALGASWSFLLCLFLVIIGGAINFFLYTRASLVFPFATMVLLIMLTFAFSMSYGYFIETRAKRQLAGLFGIYVPPELVHQMLDDPNSYNMRASNRDLSVMFCDLRGFTNLSEGMSPDAVQALLKELFNLQTRCIRKHKGTIDKYMGDCVMAFWGAPVELSKHATLALAAALEIVEALRLFNIEREKNNLPSLSIGIGLNSGLMSVGDMGSDIRRSYTVVGDEVNLAARLEGLSKLYGEAIIVSQSTRQRIQGIVWQELDRVQVSGKESTITIFTPIARAKKLTLVQEQEIFLWQQALLAYRTQDWNEAERVLKHLQARVPNKTLYRLFLQRVADFRQNPPPVDWQGITTIHKI